MAPTLNDQKPQPGDLIEIFRGLIQHWAVYVGDGFVVHLVPFSPLANKAIVKKEKLRDVVGTDEWSINNALDNKYKPRPVHVIVKEARALVNETLPYSLIGSNCEHFVNELRYGKAESRQVQKAGEVALVAGLAAPVLGLGVFALAGSSSGSSQKGSSSKK